MSIKKEEKNIFGTLSSGGGILCRKAEKRYGWVEDSFNFDEKTGKQVAAIQSTEYIGSSIKNSTVIFLRIIFSIFFLSIVFRIGYLQLVRGESYAVLARGNKERSIPIPAERGLVFDRNGVQLTENVPSFALAVIPQDLPKDLKQKKQVVGKLARLTGESEGYIDEVLTEYGAYSLESIVIKEDIDYQTALRLQIAAADLPGIYVQRGSKRLYIQGQGELATEGDEDSRFMAQSISHIMGYTGKLDREELDVLYKQGYLPSDFLGKVGVEKEYESVLRGVYGKRRVEVDAHGRQQTKIAEEAPIPGRVLQLSIDIKMQQAMEKAMQDVFEEFNKVRGVGIVSDPRNGEILALVSLPAFDNNDFSGGIGYGTYKKYTRDVDKPLFNRAISGLYPSGSTLKIAVAATALEEGLISPKTTFLSTGGISIGPWVFPDWRAGGHGMTNVRKSLAESVNTFYYYIGGGYKDFAGLGVDTITSYLKLFGFAKTLDIDLPGEYAGFLPSKEWKVEKKGERWYVGDTYNLSIGQGDVLVTPLQVNMMTQVVANGGTLFTPLVVQKIIDPVTKKEDLVGPRVIRQLPIKSHHFSTIRLGMRDCVLSGSCRRLSTLPMSVAGKTGTAQWNKNKDNHAWFTSFAPFKNPEIVVTVLVEEGEEGSRVAVPVVEKFYRWWFAYRAEEN